MLLDLSRAKELLSELDKYKGSGALDIYHAAQSERVSVTELLERMDPTERDDNGNPLQPCDAFERHLMARDIRLSGPNQHTIEMLMADTSYLMPEMVRREIEAGMNVASKFSYKDCIATTVPSKSTTYHPIYIPDLDLASAKQRNTKSLGARAASGKGGGFPRISIRKREKDIIIQDDGRVIETSYQVIRDHGWSDLAIFLRLIGAQMAVDRLYDIYDLAITGDGTVGAATNTFNGAAGTLSYSDLVHCSASFAPPFSLTRLLTPITSFETILGLAQFQDPQAFGNQVFQRTGEPVTPLGAKIKQINTVPAAAPTGTVIVALDHNYAVKEVTSQPLSVEADKIISRKFEQAAVSEETQFCVIADGALKRIVWT